jgi:lysine N6-hydroxylase
MTAHLDLVGAGIGPSNLSLAALIHPVSGVRTRFFERKPDFRWHRGMLFPGASIQVSHLKDLVTPVAPTSPFSFLAFLVAKQRLYRFINASFARVQRWEFEEYCRWVVSQLPSLRFGDAVREIRFERDRFDIRTDHERIAASHIALGTGVSPVVPDCTRPHLCASLFHVASLLDSEPDLRGKRVVIVGGGQSAAEVLAYILGKQAYPCEVSWLSRRSNFLPLDESPFTNELFSPSASRHFFQLPGDVQRRMLQEQKLASDGISEQLLVQLYQRLYELEYKEGHCQLVRLLVRHELVSITPEGTGWTLGVRKAPGEICQLGADIVILCTGFSQQFPDFLEPIAHRIERTPVSLAVDEDYGVRWEGPRQNRIFIQNGARHTHGIADPNLSLVASRSATIINSLVGGDVYPVRDHGRLLG